VCTHTLPEKSAIFAVAESRFFSSECTKVLCRWALPGPTGAAYSAPPDPVDAFDGPTSKRGEEEGGEMLHTDPVWVPGLE